MKKKRKKKKFLFESIIFCFWLTENDGINEFQVNKAKSNSKITIIIKNRLAMKSVKKTQQNESHTAKFESQIHVDSSQNVINQFG